MVAIVRLDSSPCREPTQHANLNSKSSDHLYPDSQHVCSGRYLVATARGQKPPIRRPCHAPHALCVSLQCCRLPESRRRHNDTPPRSCLRSDVVEIRRSSARRSTCTSRSSPQRPPKAKPNTRRTACRLTDGVRVLYSQMRRGLGCLLEKMGETHDLTLPTDCYPPPASSCLYSPGRAGAGPGRPGVRSQGRQYALLQHYATNPTTATPCTLHPAPDIQHGEEAVVPDHGWYRFGCAVKSAAHPSTQCEGEWCAVNLGHLP